MELLLPETAVDKLRRALRKAGRREIGGLLLAEHVSTGRFRLVDLTIQTAEGTYDSFERDPVRHHAELEMFFERTGKDFRRFNYLGEWHSHPSFGTTPSSRDTATMAAIVADPEVGVNFAVLLIVRLNADRSLAMSATAVLKDGSGQPVSVLIEAQSTAKPSTLWGRLRRFVPS